MTRKVVFAAIILLTVTLVAAAVSQAQQAPRRGPFATVPVVPAKPAPPGPLPPVPFEQYLARPAAVVQQVYEFAARHPEVLQYVPCYCGCQSIGHKGNHECFVKRRAADGRVLEWEPHGSGCAVCVDVARDAMLMFNSGASVGSIRAAIDKKYGERASTQTPTPPPPATRPAPRPGA